MCHFFVFLKILCRLSVVCVHLQCPDFSKTDSGPNSQKRKTRTNNNPVISTFRCGYSRLTLNKGPKVNFDHTKRFPANDFV